MPQMFSQFLVQIFALYKYFRKNLRKKRRKFSMDPIWNTLVFIYLFKTWSDKCKSLLTQPDGHTNTPSIDLPDEENIYALKVRVIASQVLWVLRQSYCVHNQRGDYECEERMYTWVLSFTADILSEEEMDQLWIKNKILNSITIRIKWKLREK